MECIIDTSDDIYKHFIDGMPQQSLYQKHSKRPDQMVESNYESMVPEIQQVEK